MQPQAHGLFFDVHSQSPVFGSPFVQHFVNIFQQGRIALAHTALHVGRSEMGDQYGMCSAFGNDTLAYVSGGIEIEVGEVTNQYIRPVGLRLCHILSGSIFQVAVGAEVNHRICFETFLHIQIRSQITVGRRHRHTVHQFELIISQCRAGLGEEQDIAELQAGNGDTIFCCQQIAGRISISVRHFLIFLGKEYFVCPLFVLLGRKPYRVCRFQKLFLCSFGIRTHDGTVTMYPLAELLYSGRQSADVVPFRAQAFQEVVE